MGWEGSWGSSAGGQEGVLLARGSSAGGQEGVIHGGSAGGWGGRQGRGHHRAAVQVVGDWDTQVMMGAVGVG